MQVQSANLQTEENKKSGAYYTMLPWSLIAHFMIFIYPSTPPREVNTQEKILWLSLREPPSLLRQKMNTGSSKSSSHQGDIWEVVLLMPSGNAHGLKQVPMNFL